MNHETHERHERGKGMNDLFTGFAHFVVEKPLQEVETAE
jgi:hypothetical protein